MYVYSFEKLEVWIESKDLSKLIYLKTSNYPDSEKFGLVSQLRRATISISSNIAEGSARKTYKDKAHYTTIEMEDNFQKQTNRSRMYVYSPNGIQLLNIPIKHVPNPHQKTKDVKIENDFDWQKQHFKSLEAAYRSSPFFEYFEDELRPIFEKKHTFLMDLNLETMDLVSLFLRISNHFEITSEYFAEVPQLRDYRNLANGKKDSSQFEIYPQVFIDKHGFLNNLSVLDLIFNEGKFASDYLKEQKL